MPFHNHYRVVVNHPVLTNGASPKIKNARQRRRASPGEQPITSGDQETPETLKFGNFSAVGRADDYCHLAKYDVVNREVS
jgi:hypothetical protein